MLAIFILFSPFKFTIMYGLPHHSFHLCVCVCVSIELFLLCDIETCKGLVLPLLVLIKVSLSASSTK